MRARIYILTYIILYVRKFIPYKLLFYYNMFRYIRIKNTYIARTSKYFSFLVSFISALFVHFRLNDF